MKYLTDFHKTVETGVDPRLTGVSVVMVGVNRRSHDHVITKFFRIYRFPFFLSRVRKLR